MSNIVCSDKDHNKSDFYRLKLHKDMLIVETYFQLDFFPSLYLRKLNGNEHINIYLRYRIIEMSLIQGKKIFATPQITLMKEKKSDKFLSHRVPYIC